MTNPAPLAETALASMLRHCAQYLHRAAKAHYGASVQAVEWVEATMTRLYLGKVGVVLVGVWTVPRAATGSVRMTEGSQCRPWTRCRDTTETTERQGATAASS